MYLVLTLVYSPLPIHYTIEQSQQFSNAPALHHSQKPYYNFQNKPITNPLPLPNLSHLSCNLILICCLTILELFHSLESYPTKQLPFLAPQILLFHIILFHCHPTSSIFHLLQLSSFPPFTLASSFQASHLPPLSLI